MSLMTPSGEFFIATFNSRETKVKYFVSPVKLGELPCVCQFTGGSLYFKDVIIAITEAIGEKNGIRRY